MTVVTGSYDTRKKKPLSPSLVVFLLSLTHILLKLEHIPFFKMRNGGELWSNIGGAGQGTSTLQ